MVLEDKGTAFLVNSGNRLPGDTSKRGRKFDSSVAPLKEPRIWH